MTKPFTERLRKDVVFKIVTKYLECFEDCKNMLCNGPILQYPNFTKPFILTTDASMVL